jgi:hypothetical protein
VPIVYANELESDGFNKSTRTVPVTNVFDETIPWDIEVHTQNQVLKARKKKQIGQSTTIDTSGWPEGLYIVKAVYNGYTLTGKLIVKR